MKGSAQMFNQHPWRQAQPVWGSVLRNDQHILELTGEGSVSTSPDMSIITMGVNSEDPNLTNAQQENNEKTTKVIQSLISLGISKENIKTADYRIEMVYDYENGKQTLRGYRVVHLLQVQNHQIERTGFIVDTAVRNGANTITHIEFKVKNPQIYYSQALALALSDAQFKAAELTREMGVKLNKVPLSIQELNQTSPIIPLQPALFAKSEAGTPIQPGKLKINASIQVKYSYIL
ncbi:SIMPL domain-containing protein [Neobacillus niacini]|uniref:SIMPL domain-containing protein n=1 Tax=Neobacillus niacini TaxID=86668 RepID=UPI0021CAECFA|nr:SIMPL domain-containing protein [Neobacillus niacini]MCM3768611.1 SIMPL domain-containing protein [Neobacillus niacini]